MKKLLLSDKYRPKTMDEVILLPRIRKVFQNGLDQNVILYGGFGTGKTTLARILIGKYSKDKPYIELNSSFYTSIDTLRNKVDDFCSKVYMGFDIESNIEMDSMKYVFLDEFERTSKQYQDALKAYIEDYSTKNVRFILSTNHLNKVSDGIISRFKPINFDSESPEEEKYLKIAIYKRIQEVIVPQENFEIDPEILKKIVFKKFPDIRAILIEVENFKQTGEFSNVFSNIDQKLKLELYDIIYDSSKDYNEIYHFLMNNFGSDKIDEMMVMLGKPFVEWIISNKSEDVDQLFKVANIITENTHILETKTDPIILGMSVIGQLRELFK